MLRSSESIIAIDGLVGQFTKKFGRITSQAYNIYTPAQGGGDNCSFKIRYRFKFKITNGLKGI